MAREILTRIMILSDTHGATRLPFQITEHADIVIHCGDLTEESKLSELQNTLTLLEAIDAPLKLIIAGNHDWTLDPPMFQTKLKEAGLDADDAAVLREYGRLGEARELLLAERAKSAGVVYLDEGIRYFDLENGAKLTVYASPYTPSVNDWGFQYDPAAGEHAWHLDEKVDIAITHGPPHGILDYTTSRARAGSPSLFAAIARNQPQLHCFGHIHSAWGAKRVTWRGNISECPSHFRDIDNDKSAVLESLSTLRAHKFDSEDEKATKLQRCRANDERGYCMAAADPDEMTQTLFINAAIQDASDDDVARQLPWMVDVHLPRAEPAISERKRLG